MKRLKEDTSDNESDSCEKETLLHSTSNSTITKVTKNGLPLLMTPTNFENSVFVDTSESTQELPSVLVQTKNFSGGEGLRLAKLFRNFSCFRNSLMDLGGFKRLMSQLGSNADEETMESIFQLADKDKDGHLSLDEFLKIARVAHFHPPLSVEKHSIATRTESRSPQRSTTVHDCRTTMIQQKEWTKE
ncbi:hypothetical protein GCK72_023094 [Caenorhabditis remanei]|uniref:EF-hand domain-containing protein n=1 Tax=Caenorhabditis remanei TaxID=31234 RepID=A0A6A5FVP8_CAERE|nr:hypothetical protein GCK72_023094 [Caenorhabditis remanei]KAF1746637.1 hypothetical protein GCK72_023094 [Caenorhabditis remanei]